MAARTRRRSTPPCIDHATDETIVLPSGLEFMTRCALRHSIYQDLQIDEDRAHTWALVERARQLPQLEVPAKQGQDQPMKVDVCDGWTCICGVRSPEKGIFCWKCGTPRTSVQCPDVPLRICPTSFLESSFPPSAWTNSPAKQVISASVGFRGKVPSNRSDAAHLMRSGRNTISKHSLDSLGSVISKFAPSLESLTESTVSTRGSTGNECVSSGGEGSEDKDMPTSDGPSNSGNESMEGQEITTVMICSLPFRVTHTQLVDAINDLGFKGTYDFVYMPSRSSKSRSSKAKADKSMRRGNVGYAFVNFRIADDASRFSAAFQCFQFEEVPSEKQILVKPAVCQGYEANVKLHFNKLNPGSMIAFTADGEPLACEV